MAENRGLSSSEQYIKKSNRKLFLFGVGLFVLFLIAVAFIPGGEKQVAPQKGYDFEVEKEFERTSGVEDASLLPYGSNARLVPNPEQVNMTNVVLGSKAEALIVLTAENAPILFLGAELAETQQDGFTLESTCTPNMQLAKGANCNIKVLWNPVELRQISNILYLRWRVDDGATYQEERTSIQLTAQSTDSKDCVICENITPAAPKKPKQAVLFNGNLIDIDDDGYLTLDGNRYTVDPQTGELIGPNGERTGIRIDGDTVYGPDGKPIGKIRKGLIINDKGEVIGYIDPKTGEVVLFDQSGQKYRVDPQTGELIGPNGEKTGMYVKGDIVYGPDGKPIGKIGPDGFIRNDNGDIMGYVDPNTGEIILFPNRGRATENDLIVDNAGNVIGVKEPDRIPLSLNHKIIGTIADDRQTVIDTNGEEVGKLLGDGTIVSPSNLTVIGAAIDIVSVMDSQGNVIGKMTKDGTVVDARNEPIGRPLVDGTVVDLSGAPMGTLRPWGLVIDFNGKIIGGIKPDGAVQGHGGQNIAKITPTGLAIDATGELIGGVVPQGVAVSAGCNTVGEVLLNGQVKDSFEQIVGRTLLDGTVIDQDGNDLGGVVSQGLVINEKGTTLGFVNSAGKAVNANGKLIGCVSTNGIVAAGKKPVGAIMAKGQVIANGCRVVGSVYPNGSVVTNNSETIGKVLSDKYVVNAANKIIGVVVPRGTAVAEGCRLLGLISLTGRVLDTTGADLGCVTPEGSVVNAQNTVIGAVSKRGIVVDQKGNFIGRVRIDGKIADKTGKVIGCVNPDGSLTDLEGKPLKGARLIDSQTSAGVILGPDGNPTDLTVVGTDVYNQNGEKVGTLRADGGVENEKGQIIAFIPPEGIVFSPDGLVLGRYVKNSGAVVNMKGEKFAKILPDMTAISGDKNEIIGALIADGTSFMSMDGTVIGTMQIDGILNDAAGKVAGAIRADGSVIDKSGRIIATKIPQGSVFSATGDIIGTVSPKGEVMSAARTAIGRILGNGLAISNNGLVLGAVIPNITIAKGTDGFIGTLSLQGDVIDKNGRTVGKASPFGLVLGSGGELLGSTMRVGPFVDSLGSTIGWLGFDGELTGKSGQSGQVLSNGTAVDSAGRIIGSMVPRGIAVNGIGSFVGSIAPNARVLGSNGSVVGSFKASPYFYDVNQNIAGQQLKPGIALDTNGNFIGWTRYDGVVENAQQAIGLVSLDGRIFAENGSVIGFYVPLGTPAINDSGKSFGFIGTNGLLINTKGEALGKAISPESIVQNGKLVGKLLNTSDFVSDLTSGNIIGQVSVNGSVSNIKDARPLGTAMMNGLVLNLTKQIIGGMTPIGTPIAETLNVLGQGLLNGHIFSDSRFLGTTSATKAIFDLSNQVIGHVIKPSAYIGRDGNIIGAGEGGASVMSVAGTAIANQMPFGSALTSETLWAGNQMPSGSVLTDDGYNIGTIAADGAIIGEKDAVMGRILPDGTASGIIERMTYTTMPYVGSVARQGVPVHFKGTILGRTTMDGGVLDATDKRINTLLDDGSIMGKADALDGFVIPFGNAINHDGDLLGMLSGDGSVVTAGGTIKGRIASNGSVEGPSVLVIEGAMVPTGLVTNGCTVLGQTSLSGQIINGKGSVVGRVMVDKTAINKSGERIGHVAIIGSALSSDGAFMGRSLANGSVVDARGSNIGCVAENGDVTDNSGAVMGCILQRGPVISPDGKMLGRSKFDGTIVNASNTIIGKMGGDCKEAFNMEGQSIGRIVPPSQRLVYNENGTLAGTLALGGEYYTPKGEHVFTVKGDKILDPITEKTIGFLDRETGIIKTANGDTLTDMTVIRGKDGSILGLISGCNVLNTEGTKIASIMADGSIIDLNGELYATISGNGTVYAKDGSEMGSIAGMNTHLDRCGIKSTSFDGMGGSAAGRRIFIGKNAYNITSTGSLVTEDGTVVGYMGQDGRPYSLANKPLTGAGMDSEGRTRPNIDKKMAVNPEQIEQMQQLLAQKRQGMRGGIKNAIRPNGRILARSKKKEDKDWGLPRIVSSWPVKMTNMILRDKAIPAVLVRSIDSRYKDVPATAIVERHIYSEEGRNIIIPAGSRLIGKISGSPGENHVAKMDLTWERLIRPDGGAFTFSASSGDAQGRGGVAAYLDEQLLAKYGKPILSSSVTSAIAYLAASNDPVSTTENGTTTQSDRSKAAEDARETFTDNMEQIFQQLIDESTSIPPVVFVPAGTRLTVFSNEDLWLRSAEEDEREYDETFGAAPTAAQNVGTNSWIDKRGTPADQIAAGATQGNAATDVYYNPDDSYYAADATLDQTDFEQQMANEGVLYGDESVIDQQDFEPAPTAQQSVQDKPKTPSSSDLTNRVSRPVLPKSQQSSRMF